MRNLLTTLLISTGVPMLTAGDETGRTQLGNNNAYCVDDETTWVDWTWVDELGSESRRSSSWRLDLLDWTRELLRLRRTHPALGQGDFFDGRAVHEDGRTDLAWFASDGQEMTDTEWFDHDRRVIGGYVAHPVPGGESLLLLVNTGPDEAGFVLPAGNWATAYRCLLDTTDERPEPADTDDLPGGTVQLAAHSLRLFSARHRAAG
jgi:glycogen operon protein